MAPSPAENWRRLREAFMSGPPHLAGRAQDGGDDAVVRPAAAEIAGEPGPYLLLARARIGLDQRLARP